MTDDTPENDRRTERPTDGGDAEVETPTRRSILETTAAAGAGLAALGLGSSSALARGAPTPWLERDGNRIRDPTGGEVVLRGVNTADPKRVNVTAPARGKDVEDVIELATNGRRDWHARVVRLPVQPVDIGEHPPGQGPPPVAFTEEQLESYLDEHLDPAIRACKRNGVYAIVDYHRHRNVSWTNPDLDEEIRMFWDAVAPRYAEDPNVLFEVYNEPQTPGMWGPISNGGVQDVWQQWKSTAQPWVDVIRDHAPRNLILVGSPSWSQSPEGALIEEFDGDNLAYTYHIYPGHGISQNENWDDDASWANGGEGTNAIYEEVPLFVTEFGWQEGAGPIIGGTTSDFGEPFREWLDNGPIHWTAWNFDPIWAPVMWERDFETEPTGNPYDDSDGPVPELCDETSHDECDWTLLGGDAYMGEFVKDFLADRARDDVPIFGDRPGRGRGRGRGYGDD